MANSLTHTLPFPVRKARFTLQLPFRTSAGVPTDPTTPDTEKSTDGGATFSDCAEEVTTGGGNGTGYITLTGAEMDNATLEIAAKSANCVTTNASIRPRTLPTIHEGTAIEGNASDITLQMTTRPTFNISGCIIRTTGGTGGGGTGGANNQARVVDSYDTSTGVATVVPPWETEPDSSTTYDVLLTEMAVNALRANVTAIDGSELAAVMQSLAALAIYNGVVTSGTVTTLVDASLADFDDDVDQLKGRVVIFDRDTLTAGLRLQGTRITGQSGTTLTFEQVTAAPASGDTYVII